MKPCVLFRRDLDSEGELAAARACLPTYEYRSQIPPGSLVLGRYSVLPYYRELERELALNGSRLINTYAEHSFIADALAWSQPGGTLYGLTPRSWADWGSLPEGAYVVKGRTNSRKHQWQTHMFAPTRAAIPEIAQRLNDDALIRDQGLVVREYVPLKQLRHLNGDPIFGLNGLPITNEWRTLWLRTDCGLCFVDYGFYWASHPEALPHARWTSDGADMARAAATRVGPHATFFALDVAETADGNWIVVEINDGQMSGLPNMDPAMVYRSLAGALEWRNT